MVSSGIHILALQENYSLKKYNSVCPRVEKRSSSFLGIACKSRRRSWGKSHCRVQTLSHTLACLHILSRTPQRPSAHHYHSLPHRPLLGFQHLTKIIRKFSIKSFRPIKKLFEAVYSLPPLINLWTDFTNYNVCHVSVYVLNTTSLRISLELTAVIPTFKYSESSTILLDYLYRLHKTGCLIPSGQSGS